VFDKLGIVGIGGVVLVVAGIGLVASESLIVAGGIALVLAGLGLVVRGLVATVMEQFGLA
jgi:hypothetical protein